MKGMLSLSEPGYGILTDRDLTDSGFPNNLSEGIFAVFQVSADPDFCEQVWDGSAITQAVAASERRNLYRNRANAASLQDVKLISLRELLQARLV
ncbi:MAG: hypothetical protein IPN16_18985 [Gemmatimonadetes bacterium]|nr:hypothetical protein [Gemmatimonadota bacterium]